MYAYAPEADGTISAWMANDREVVEFEYAGDGLGQIDTVTINGDANQVQYDTGNRLSELGGSVPLKYQYDEYGRITLVSGGDLNLRYEYLPNDQGYQIVDEATDETLRFLLNENGFLSQLETDTFSYLLNPDGRILVVQIARENGEFVELRLNRRGETQTIVYTQSNLFIDYVTDQAGNPQRESIIGFPEFFESGGTGYISVIGYDNDDRPLTVRITDRDTGELIYLLSFTYNQNGQRDTETRQYPDGTQVTYEFMYEGNLLLSRTITISNAMQTVVNGSPALLLIGLAAWAMQTPRRRRTVLIATICGILTVLALGLTGAQPADDDLTHELKYDQHGNLTAISAELGGETTICTTYTYDGANRLIGVSQDGFEQTFGYDLLHRLNTVGTERLLYYAQTDKLVGTNNGTTRYLSQTNDRTGFIASEDTNRQWLLNDGRTHILGVMSDDGTPDTIWLFDPLGRFLELQPPSYEDDICLRTLLPSALNQLAPMQAFTSRMIWDSVTNLYFVAGRAYSPELGRFLQRDPQGPDAFGNVYSFPTRQVEPPIVASNASFAHGLRTLERSLSIVQNQANLQSTAVLARHQPSAAIHNLEPMLGNLNRVAQNQQLLLQRQLDLPKWLETQYSLPGPYIDDAGALRMVHDHAPGHGGLPDEYVEIGTRFDPTSLWLPHSPAPESNALIGHQSIQDGTFSSYDTFAWQPSQQSHMVDRPDFSQTNLPDIIWDWMPQPMNRFETIQPTLEIIAALEALPTRTNESWLQNGLNLALPDKPDLPPMSAQAYLENWFTSDTLGISRTLQDRWPLINRDPVPVYRLGQNGTPLLDR